MIPRPPRSTLFPYPPLSRSLKLIAARNFRHDRRLGHLNTEPDPKEVEAMVETQRGGSRKARDGEDDAAAPRSVDRKSTRLNSSHANISYAVFCLKKKLVAVG